MGIRNDAGSLIFFAFWNRRRLPAGRQACLPAGREDVLKVIGRTPDYQLCPNYILISSCYWQSSSQSYFH
jgi:hypothetical protein